MASAEGRENVNHRKSLWAGWSCIKVVEQVECILISALSQRKIFRNRVSAGTAWEFWDILKANSKLEKQVKGFVKKTFYCLTVNLLDPVMHMYLSVCTAQRDALIFVGA